MKEEQHFITTLQSEEQELYELITKKINQGTIIDVGAHHGVVTEFFLIQGWKSYAFEPMETNLEKLRQRLGNQKNLFIRTEAVSDSSGHKNLHVALNSDNSVHEYYHSLENIGEDAYHKKGNTISIKTTSLNDLVSQQQIPQKIDFLKIDTEGHDLAVLRGSEHLECQAISVEFWQDNHALGTTPSPAEAMVKLLQNRGYEQYIVIERLKDSRTYYHYSSLATISNDSWGNIFFFNHSQDELYQDAIALCEELKINNQSQHGISSINKILKQLHQRDEEISIVDVGTYRGDFTSDIIHEFPKTSALLFEPTPNSFNFLENKFIDNPLVKIFNLALSNYESDDVFYLLEDGATNSLLYPLDKTASEIKTSVRTLDKFWQENSKLERLDILKIDTQGNDLKVLQGAKETIKQYSPCILVEVIFIDLYQTQNSYYEIIQCMQDYGYSLASICNIHYGERGLLAFADFFFLPNHKLQKIKIDPNENFNCYDVEYLIEHNQVLQKTCDERLALINTLDQAAKERLNLIQTLDIEVKRLQNELAKVTSNKK